jgi:hypothetical protein
MFSPHAFVIAYVSLAFRQIVKVVSNGAVPVGPQVLAILAIYYVYPRVRVIFPGNIVAVQSGFDILDGVPLETG